MLVSNDTDALRKARFLAMQAKDPAPHYQHSTTGYNYRMSNLLAGVGRAQLRVLEERVNGRRAVYRRYVDALDGVAGIELMPELPATRSNRWLTALTVDEKAAGLSSGQLLAALSEHNIEARPVWKPLHMQPLFHGTAYYAHEPGCSVSERLFLTGLCLPSGSNMAEEEQARVISCMKESMALADAAYANRSFYVS